MREYVIFICTALNAHATNGIWKAKCKSIPLAFNKFRIFMNLSGKLEKMYAT